MEDILMERYELAYGRLADIPGEIRELGEECPEWFAFFETLGNWLLEAAAEERAGRSFRELRDLTEPVRLSEERHGQMLEWLFYELKSLETFDTENHRTEVVIRLELFLEIYAGYYYAWKEEHRLPEEENIRMSIYWFGFDYADMAAEKYVSCLEEKGSGEENPYLYSGSILYDFLTAESEEHSRTSALFRQFGDKAYFARKLEVFRNALEKSCLDKAAGEEYFQRAKKYVAHPV